MSEPRRRGRTILYAAVLVLFVAAVLHPVRRYLVEPKREVLLGYHEPAGRRLALASQFGFATASGASVRVVPGPTTLDLSDLPTQAITLILGGFRGPYVVWLWIRVEEEKRSKLYFDLIDRYTKIAALQSDYPQIWVFHMWNMAWNVSVQWQSPERKYQWIRRAIEFGTEGYRRNPRSAEIMAEIGRIYSEKIGRAQEASYYRRRVWETEGRSPFLIAYEWYDRARKANDRYGTLRYGLSKPVTYSQACHSLTYYATELTQQAYDELQAALDAGTTEADRRKAFDRGRERLAEAIAAWQWARREWREHALRFEKEGTPGVLDEVYQRFYRNADQAATQLEAIRADLTFETLPDVFKKMKRPELT